MDVSVVLYFTISVQQVHNIYKQYLFLKALLHVSMCYVIILEFLIMYDKVIKSVKWKLLCRWLLQTINGVTLIKTSDMSGCLRFLKHLSVFCYI